MNFGIPRSLVSYVSAASVFLVIDLLWIGFIAQGLYQHYIGDLLAERVNWAAALIFYAVYIGGIQVFVLSPALDSNAGIARTAMMGALLGFFAYSTFDLTCLALIRNWPLAVTVIDILWGTFLTAGTSAGSLWLIRSVFRTV